MSANNADRFVLVHVPAFRQVDGTILEPGGYKRVNVSACVRRIRSLVMRYGTFRARNAVPTWCRRFDSEFENYAGTHVADELRRVLENDKDFAYCVLRVCPQYFTDEDKAAALRAFDAKPEPTAAELLPLFAAAGALPSM